MKLFCLNITEISEIKMMVCDTDSESKMLDRNHSDVQLLLQEEASMEPNLTADLSK